MTKAIFGVLLYLFLVPSLAAEPAAASGTVLQEGMVNPGYHEPPGWFKHSFLDIREDVQEAAEEGRRVLLYFYQDGCPYCKKLLETSFSQRDIVEKVRRYFDVIAINMWGDREVTGLDGTQVTEKAFASGLKVMFTPTMLFLNEKGEVVLRLNGYYPPHRFAAVVDYVGQHLENRMSFREFWAEREPVAASGTLHRDPAWLQPPWRLDSRGNDRPLLVMFEQKDCATCDELHLDILKQERSRELLKGFDIALVDMWSSTPVRTPDGRDTTVSQWARDLGVQYAPTLVMFDASGKEVFRTEAWLRTFHVQAALEYVLSGAYREQPSFQRYVQSLADAMEKEGRHVDLME